MFLYLIIGILYVLFNYYVLKIDNESTGLVMAWIFAWPLFLSLRIITTIMEKCGKDRDV